jgi:hypothetical protein
MNYHKCNIFFTCEQPYNALPERHHYLTKILQKYINDLPIQKMMLWESVETGRDKIISTVTILPSRAGQ